MKVYTVHYYFKSNKDYEKFMFNMDSHPTIQYLSKKGNVKALDCDEFTDANGKNSAGFYFKRKKDAVVFAKAFNIPVSNIIMDEHDFSNPWLPEGMSYDDCIEIYGDIPGDRG